MKVTGNSGTARVRWISRRNKTHAGLRSMRSFPQSVSHMAAPTLPSYSMAWVRRDYASRDPEESGCGHPRIPVDSVRVISEIVAHSTAGQHFNMLLLTIIGVSAIIHRRSSFSAELYNSVVCR